MFELFLSKTPNKEASPAVARKPRHPAKKFSSHFLICARPIFSSKRKRKLLCGVLLSTSRTAGLSASRLPHWDTQARQLFFIISNKICCSLSIFKYFVFCFCESDKYTISYIFCVNSMARLTLNPV